MATRGGGRGDGRDDRDKGKRRFTVQEKEKWQQSYDEEEDVPDTLDWRESQGVIGPVLNQKLMPICFAIAIAMVRAIQALLNINLPEGNQIKELSIQHVVNKLPYSEDDGIQNVKRAFTFAVKKGTCSSSQCPTNTFDGNVAEKFECRHPNSIHTEKIDEFEYITDVKDDELKALVAQQPVIGILRNTGLGFYEIGSGIYTSPTGSHDESFHQVLIVGYGFDKYGRPYWIIQNSYGEAWGERGFGYVYRRIKRDRGSEFHAVAYPKKRGYPRKKDGA